MITGSVNGQTLTVMTPLVAADSVNYITCAFAFSDDWDDLDKYVHFAKGEASYSALIADDGTVGEMAHINLPAGVWNMYVHGEAVVDDFIIKRITTNIFKLRVERTGMIDGDPFPEITPGIGEQIIAQATAQANAAAGSAASAEADAERAENAADRSETASEHAPYIGANGNWFVWDSETQSMVDTGVPASGGGDGTWESVTGKPFSSIGENLKVVNGSLVVDTANAVQEDNTKPITSAAVFVEVGNIDALLATI